MRAPFIVLSKRLRNRLNMHFFCSLSRFGISFLFSLVCPFIAFFPFAPTVRLERSDCVQYGFTLNVRSLENKQLRSQSRNSIRQSVFSYFRFSVHLFRGFFLLSAFPVPSVSARCSPAVERERRSNNVQSIISRRVNTNFVSVVCLV